MSTKNPKVSAYIPQHIFDRFQSFCQDKGLSMSQATAVVFAGYFEIEPEVNHLSGLLADRVLDLESKVSNLSGLDFSLISSLLSRVEKLESEKADIEFSSGSKAEPLESTPVPVEKDRPQQLSTFGISGNGFTREFIAKGLNGGELAKRLGMSQSMISKHKESQELAAWSKGKDPESIAWSYDSITKKFLPVTEPLA
jgi:hypothetical protein